MKSGSGGEQKANTVTMTTTPPRMNPVAVPMTTTERSSVRCSSGTTTHNPLDRFSSKTIPSVSPVRVTTELKMSSATASQSESSDDSGTIDLNLSPDQASGIRVVPQVQPDCQYLYKIPPGLHRYYQPLPIWLQVMSLFVATWLAALSTLKKITWWQPLSILYGLRPAPSINQMLSFLLKAITYTVLSQAVLQEIVGRPSQVSIQTLLQRYFLPSKLSKYQIITVPGVEKDETPFSLGVHFLEYHNPHLSVKNDKNEPMFDALYMQHGFGASSLSWLPAIPSLVHRLGARVGLAHDAVGFGFTDRPLIPKWYTSKQSARIAHQILLQQQHQQQQDDVSMDSTNRSKVIALMGHSMGSLAMLRLATQLPSDWTKFIVLSAPALGINHRKAPLPLDYHYSWMRRKLVHPIVHAAQQSLLVPLARYLLRRVVGTRGSWRAGLKGVWGDPTKVTDGDVLRFSWPAIYCGWEEGILRFASAQGLRREDELDDDRTLMQHVLELPNTKVAIILGSKDRVVTPHQVREFMKSADTGNKVPIIELEGLGHDAFEEDEERFCSAVDDLLESLQAAHDDK